MPHPCLNCNAVLQPDQRFCGQCGQRVGMHRLTLHDIWHDVIHYFTHADKGIFSLFKQLVIRPGMVAREYVMGQRKRHFPPLNFFLIVAALYVFMNSITEKWSPPPSAAAYQQRSAQTIRQAEPTVSKAIAEKRYRIGRFFSRNANWVAMFAAPFIGLLMWLFFWRARYNYTEHLVANLYLIGFTNLVRCLLITPLIALLAIPASSRALQMGFMVFEIIYRTVFYYQFMGKPGVRPVLWLVLVSVLCVVIWVALIYLWIMLGPYII